MTPDFEYANKAATRLLIKQDLSSLFIDVRKFAFDRKIVIDSIQHYSEVAQRSIQDLTCDEISGCFLLKYSQDINIILYDKSELNEERKHWGIAHELGHIYMDHSTDSDTAEIEANFFAAQLTMPEIILRELAKKNNYIDEIYIANNFNVSLESARKRINTLKRRQCFFPTPLDTMLLFKMQGITFNDSYNNSFNAELA